MANWVWTKNGLMLRELLELREVFTDSEDSCSHCIEWWHGDELVKRSVAVHMKKGLQLKGAVNDG